MKLSESAHAKINLTLDVLYKRNDGYHEVEMVMTTIDLADRIDFSLREDATIRLQTSSSYIPSDRRNLVHAAATYMQTTYNVQRGADIYINKRIPVAAGLAGGSSDAAAAIRGLNKLWNLRLSIEEMARIGAQIGSDVPFCVVEGTAVATGRGERLQMLPPPPPFWVVLVKPSIGVSTATIYKKLNVAHISNRPDTETMTKALHEGDFDALTRSMGNVLEPVTFAEYPQVKRLKEQMIQFGADGVLMSGSGPTVFAVFRKETRARRLCNSLRGFCRQVFVVRVLGRSRFEPMPTTLMMAEE